MPGHMHCVRRLNLLTACTARAGRSSTARRCTASSSASLRLASCMALGNVRPDPRAKRGREAQRCARGVEDPQQWTVTTGAILVGIPSSSLSHITQRAKHVGPEYNSAAFDGTVTGVQCSVQSCVGVPVPDRRPGLRHGVHFRGGPPHGAGVRRRSPQVARRGSDRTIWRPRL